MLNKIYKYISLFAVASRQIRLLRVDERRKHRHRASALRFEILDDAYK